MISFSLSAKASNILLYTDFQLELIIEIYRLAAVPWIYEQILSNSM